MNKNAMMRLSIPVLPALVVAGASLNPAAALELGDIQIQSGLGQPLRASIAYALGPNEALADYCISLAPGLQLNGMPNVGRANITVGDGVISLTGKTPVREPLMTARVSINCPFTAQVTREFLLLVDPGESAAGTRYAGTPPAAVPAPQAVAAPPQPRAPRPAARRERQPVAIGATYRVQPGDSLSDIALRLEGRQVGLWQAVNAIFVANPGAFIDADPNQLKAGSLLAIPASTTLSRVAPTFAAANEPVEPATATPVVATVDDTAYLEPATSPVYEPVIDAVESPMPIAAATASVPAEADPTETVIDVAAVEPEPVTAPAPAAELNTAAVATVDTELVVPAVPPPAKIEAAVQPASQPVSPAGSNYAVWWTLGGALALIGGVFAWRRRRPAEGVFVPEVAARAPHPMRRATDENSIEVRVLGSAQDAADIDFNLSDDSPTEENLALDVNLFEGHGLSESTDMERADFGFAETTDLDLELTEAAARETNEPGTDVIPPLRRSAGSILESEVLPEEEDYDMSVNMDATKMPQPDDVTGRDLQAVVLDAGDKTQEEETFAFDQENDYEVLEQDYEDELTATQAFNEEIERAARELQSDREAIEAATAKAEQHSSDDTSAMPFASVTELDLAESMSAGNDDVVDDETAISGLDDTGIHEPLTFSLDTQAITAELERPDDDIDYDAVTANLEIKSGKGAG